MERIDLVRERFDNTAIENIDQKQAYLDLKILFDEIQERDVLISDFSEQIVELRERVSELKKKMR